MRNYNNTVTKYCTMAVPKLSWVLKSKPQLTLHLIFKNLGKTLAYQQSSLNITTDCENVTKDIKLK